MPPRTAPSPTAPPARSWRRARRRGACPRARDSAESDAALAVARDVAAGAQLPLVLDADGLNAHAGELESLAVSLGADSDHAARRRAGASARAGTRTRSARTASRPRVRPPSAAAASSCSRATTRSSRAWRAGRGERRLGACARHGGHRRRPGGHDRRALARRAEPFEAACAGVWANTNAGVAAAEQVGRGRVRDRERRDRRAPRGAPSVKRAVARSRPWRDRSRTSALSRQAQGGA